MASTYNPFRRGANPLGGTTWFGGAPTTSGARRQLTGDNTMSSGVDVPKYRMASYAPYGAQSSIGRGQSGRGGGGGSGINFSMPSRGRRGGAGGVSGEEYSSSRKPTFANADAYYAARGSGLDYLNAYGPNRDQTGGSISLGGNSYGGRSATPTGGSLTNPAGTQVRSGDSVIDFTTGRNLQADTPYTNLTGDSVSSIPPVSPAGHYSKLAEEQQALMAQGLEAGRAAANEVRSLQNTAPSTSVTSEPFGTGRLATGAYGRGVSTQGLGLPKSFGRFGAPTPQADREAELGEAAIVSRAKQGVTVPSLLNSYTRRSQK
jgi:hypothetical protein